MFEPSFDLDRRRATFALIGLVALLMVVRIVRHAPAHYSGDGLYWSGLARAAMVRPAVLFELDYTGRIHPLFAGTLGIVDRLVGPSLPWWIALAYAGHLVAVLQLRRLVAAVTADDTVATLAAGLFAVFPGANNLFADPIHFARPWNLALALLALNALIAGRQRWYLGLYVVTLANYEDTLLLPVIGLAIDRWRGGRAVHGLAMAVMVVVGLGLTSSTGHGYPLAPLAEVAWKAATLPLELIRAGCLLRSDVLQPPLLRAVIVAPLVVFGIVAMARRPLGLRRLAPIAAMTLLTAAPYLLRSTGGEWPSRYLYLPAAVAVVGAGWLLRGGRRGEVWFVVAYATIVGVTTTEKAADVIAMRHLHRFQAPLSADLVIDGVARSLRRSADTESSREVVVAGSAADCSFIDGDLVQRTRVRLICTESRTEEP